MISKWNYLPFTSEEKRIEEELTEYVNSRPISELLIRRGVTSVKEAKKFFHPSLSDLHDPFLMQDMDKAVNRLNKAMGKKERIMVFGDYDVDGTSAVALVYLYLRNYYSNVDYYIPTRYDEGYGISRKNIDYALEKGVKLIIVLDCGIKEFDSVKYAKENGIDFIICDHHVPDEELPEAVAILNPKMKNSNYPCPHLCGCGVGFKFMQGFSISNGLNDNGVLESLLDLVAMATAVDIVPMIGENRILTHHGLIKINHSPNLGIRSIMKICNLNKREITINDVVFKIGPRINASGRMQSGMEAVDLLTARNFTDAIQIAQTIDQYNSDRKELDKKITDEANSILLEAKKRYADKRSIVVCSEDWHKGIIGIVASRLTELYYKPSVVLSLENGIATGSSRSVQGFDVYKAVAASRDLLENFGGHAYAVGLTLKEENIAEFARRFEEYVAENIEPHQLNPKQDIDAYITFKEITQDFMLQLKMFNPFGAANQKPEFCSLRVRDCGTSKLVGKKLEHIKLDLVDDSSSEPVNGIAFNMSEYFPHIKQGKPFDILFTIEENKRQANSIQLQVKDIRIPNEE